MSPAHEARERRGRRAAKERVAGLLRGGRRHLEADVLLPRRGPAGPRERPAVYRDIANVKAYAERDLTYRELCVPQWLRDEPPLFWGFWGLCSTTTARRGPTTAITSLKWRDAMFASSDVAEVIGLRVAEQEKQTSLEDLKTRGGVVWTVTPPAPSSPTSNVDAHFYDVLDAGEIRMPWERGALSAAEEGGRRGRGRRRKGAVHVEGSGASGALHLIQPYAVSTETMLAEDGIRHHWPQNGCG